MLKLGFSTGYSTAPTHRLAADQARVRAVQPGLQLLFLPRPGFRSLRGAKTSADAARDSRAAYENVASLLVPEQHVCISGR